MKISLRIRGIARNFLILLILALSSCISSPPIIVAPAVEKAPAVILLSGLGGETEYQFFAEAVAKLGYVAVLEDANSIVFTRPGAGENLRKLIAAVQQDPRVIPGKVAVIGFSLGGRAALVYGTSHRETVSAVVAFYPAISGFQNIPQTAAQVAVPTLILSGEKDRFLRCCLIESMREFQSAARKAGAPVTLVSYPGASHGFNIPAYPTQYRPEDAADAWERTKSFLKEHHSLP